MSIAGFDWLAEQEEYSILNEAIRISGVKKGFWWKQYTIFAEHDSIYNKEGIYDVTDLISKIATPGKKLNDKTNDFYAFAAYHIVGGEFYLNELDWGSEKYWTRANAKPLTINVGVEIQINPGIDEYGYKVTQLGDTIVIDYIRVLWDASNNITSNGPVHSISNILHYKAIED